MTTMTTNHQCSGQRKDRHDQCDPEIDRSEAERVEKSETSEQKAWEELRRTVELTIPGQIAVR